MPEGHTIHRIAREQNRVLRGRTVAVSSPQGRFADEAALIDGSVLLRVEPYGKHLFYEWGTGHLGHVHLGLFGGFRRTDGPGPDDGPAVRMRLQVTGEDGRPTTFDLSGPTACTLGDPGDRDAIVQRLGPDPLRRDARPEVTLARISRSRQPIGALLLDQAVIAGVGNVYRAEVLFACAIHPLRPGNTLTAAELDAIWATTVTFLRKGVKEGRIVTLGPDDLAALGLRSTARGWTGWRRGAGTYVYHRDRCLRCGTPILTVKLGGRPCWYCPTCQPHGAAATAVKGTAEAR